MATSASRLPSLPVEVIENIARRTEHALIALHATCRELQNKTWNMFKERYFSTRQVWINRKSLEMLLDISNHKSLTSAVCTVVVSPHHFSPGALRSHDGKAVDEEGSTTRRNLLYNQQILIQGGIATDMLREAFSQLKGLRHVEIGFAARSVKSILPASDADVDWKMVRNYKWSNGIARMKKTIGMSPITDEDDNMDSLWLVVWSSIGLSKTPLESFGYTRRSNLHALDIQSIKICSTFLMFNATCITSLRKLSLLIDSSNIWGSRHLWR